MYKNLVHLLILLLIFFLGAGCSVKPVVFKPDDVLFDTMVYKNRHRTLFYDDLLGIELKSIELEKGALTEVKIDFPVLFRNMDSYLVYPGETINAGVDEQGDLDLRMDGNERRSKELRLFKEIYYLRQAVASNNVPGNSRVKRDEHVFDSLTASYKLSKKFVKTGKKIFLARSLREKWYSSLDKDSSAALKQLLEYVNNIKSIELIQYQLHFVISQVADDVLPTRIWNIRSVDSFKQLFDSSTVYFQGIARDFVLTKILWMAYYRRLDIPREYVSKYNNICKTRKYKWVAKKLHNSISEKNEILKAVGGDALGTLENKTTNIQNVLKENIGKVILLDFWATWCVPCRQHVRHLDSLKTKLPSSQFKIIALSIDRNEGEWKKYFIQEKRDKEDNYIFYDLDKSEFAKKYNIKAVPRYILINKEGKVVAEDAPEPDNTELMLLIRTYL